MTIVAPSAAALAAVSVSGPSSLPSSSLSTPPAPDRAEAIFRAAGAILPALEAGARVDAGALRAAMHDAFGGSDAEGFWGWKDAYDACEIAQVLFLRRFGPSMRGRAEKPATMLAMLEKVARLLPSHTKRSAESQALQQLSTPIPLAFVAAHAAGLTAADLVLEPSAGTGLLAVFAELAGASPALNELADMRAALLRLSFPGVCVTGHDAAHIDDHLDAGVRPSVVLMNPPFSAGAKVEGRVTDAALRHVSSALARLAEGGRLVAITGANFSPDNPSWREAFIRLQEKGRIVFSAAIDGRVYARHGTSVDTRLTVIDRVPADRPDAFPASPGKAGDVATLLGWVEGQPPPRPPVTRAAAGPLAPSLLRTAASRAVPQRLAGPPARPAAAAPDIAAPELAYETCEWRPAQGGRLTDAIYEGYSLQSIRIPGAQTHPTALVQSAAMASVAPPKPSYRPHLPARIVAEGLLSDSQCESVIYAGEAHSGHLAGAWTVDDTFDTVSAAPDDAENAIRFRRGWFLGDGTGAGKGRQAAGILLDNWLKGRRKALWISKSDKLIEDAQRDWSALGQERLLITPLSRFRQGMPIRLEEGILFTTYATIRSQEREGKASRVSQIVEWLGRDFDGVIIFDEAHAMANAAGGKGERGDQAASQQGKAGLRLQHAMPQARIVYVSATGATAVQNLAYAQRLGIWGGEDFPFATRAEFVQAIEAGGVAAMEVLARDLKALGLYAARSLSYEGVEYELTEHTLTGEQIAIYDSYAGAFHIIHNNLHAAMQATNITGASGTLNAQAKSAARSAFESSKQRFFSHLITSMKTPTLIAQIDRDLAEGHAAIVQIVSTGEALMERRLADIPTEEWSDVQVDITPREYVLDYLQHSFPTQFFEEYSDEEGNIASRPVFHDGQPVQCREAVERRKKEAAQARKQAARHLENRQAEQDMLVRQQAERLALHAAQMVERDTLLFRLRRAVADMIARIPGLRSVLGPIQKMTHLDPRERHRLEDAALARRHGREKLDIERRKRFEARIEKREALSREKALRKERRLAQEIRIERDLSAGLSSKAQGAKEETLAEAERTAGKAQTVENKAMQDFHDAARDDGLWKHREFDEGELSRNFNDAADFVEGADGGDEESFAPDWARPEDDGNDDGPKFTRRPGKRRGYRRGGN